MSNNPLITATDISGRNVIVTGATSGIGQGIAEALAHSGCNVLINGLGERDQIEAYCRELAASTGSAIFYSDADMAKPDQIEAMFLQAREELGSIDGVVNNAGVQHISAIEDFPTSQWDLILAVNLSSAFHTTRLAFAEMKARGWGRIINIGSAATATSKRKCPIP